LNKPSEGIGMRITFSRCIPYFAGVGLSFALQACAFLAGLTSDEQLLQADRERSVAQGEFRKSEISYQNQNP
jgi:hypothetical protein